MVINMNVYLQESRLLPCASVDLLVFIFVSIIKVGALDRLRTFSLDLSLCVWVCVWITVADCRITGGQGGQTHTHTHTENVNKKIVSSPQVKSCCITAAHTCATSAMSRKMKDWLHLTHTHRLCALLSRMIRYCIVPATVHYLAGRLLWEAVICFCNKVSVKKQQSHVRCDKKKGCSLKVWFRQQKYF